MLQLIEGNCLRDLKLCPWCILSMAIAAALEIVRGDLQMQLGQYRTWQTKTVAGKHLILLT